MENRALGKGLSALISQKAEENVGSKDGVQTLPVRSIRYHGDQPRKDYSSETIDELKSSIKERGILQPILVRKSADGYEVIAGERRLRAAQALNMERIPAIVKEVSDSEAFVLALIENIQREDLNPIEQASAFHRLISDYRMTHDELAKSVGKDRSTITNALRLLRLPKEIQDAVVSGEISMGHARTILAIDDEKEQMQIYRWVVDKGASVRDVERLVQERRSGAIPKKVRRDPEPPSDFVFIEEDLQRTLGSKVRIFPRKRRGRIVIEYYSPDDLDRIIRVIKGGYTN